MPLYDAVAVVIEVFVVAVAWVVIVVVAQYQNEWKLWVLFLHGSTLFQILGYAPDHPENEKNPKQN